MSSRSPHHSATQAAVQAAVVDLAAATDGASRRAVLAHLERVLGVSTATAYRLVQAAGWQSGRKPRADKGRSAVSTEDLREVAAIMAAGRNKRGQPNIPTTEAMRIAEEQDLPAAQLSYGRVKDLLRREGLSMGHLRAQEAGISRVTERPNQAWFFDISIAIQWYFRDAATGKRIDIYNDAGARFYKPDQWQKVRKVIHRYCIVDHYSGAYWVQYYYSSGERAADVVDFLYSAMAPKGALAQAYPFRGLPEVLVMDQGSANKSSLVQTLLGKDGLNIQVQLHAAGNAKASGAVESRHEHWQKSYEGRLRLEPAEDIPELNANAAKWCAVANAERAHTRHGRSPMQAWVTLPSTQLREAPDRESFFALASTAPRTGTLDMKCWLRADGRKWYVSGPHVHTGQKVRYRISPYVDQGIRVWDADSRELAVEELRFDVVSNFPLNGPREIIGSTGEDAGAAIARTPAQELVHQVEEGVREVSYDVFSGLDERIARQAFLSPQGQPWQASTSLLAAPTLLGSLDARDEVVRRLGRSLSIEEGAWWRERTAEGVTTADLDTLFEQFVAGDDATADTQLRHLA